MKQKEKLKNAHLVCLIVEKKLSLLQKATFHIVMRLLDIRFPVLKPIQDRNCILFLWCLCCCVKACRFSVETGHGCEFWPLQIPQVPVCGSEAQSSRSFWSSKHQVHRNDNPTVSEFLQTVQGNCRCNWNCVRTDSQVMDSTFQRERHTDERYLCGEKCTSGAGEMARGLRVLLVLPEDSSSISRNHMTAHNCL